MGFIKDAKSVFHQLYSNNFKIQACRTRSWRATTAGEQARAIKTHFDPLPFWYATFEDQLNSKEEYPLHAVTSVPLPCITRGSQNAWLRQLHGYNKLYLSKRLADQHALADL